MATRPEAVRPTRRSATATALNFRVNECAAVARQIQYAWNNKKGDPSLTGQIKFGGWRHFGSFADQRLASNGVSLAAAASSSGEPLLLSGDVGGWAVFEQQIHRVPHSDDRGIGVFARAAGSPADRNLIDLYADVGVEFIGLRDDRPDDKFGIAAGYAHVSKRAQALDANYRTLVDMTWPVRSFEGLLTAVYQLSGQGRLDVTAQFPIHRSSRRWRHAAGEPAFRQASQERVRVRSQDHAQVLGRCAHEHRGGHAHKAKSHRGGRSPTETVAGTGDDELAHDLRSPDKHREDDHHGRGEYAVAAFMRMAILSWLSSGCEPLPGGQPYENDYCFVFVVAGDSIKQVREYMDTRKGWQMIFKPD